MISQIDKILANTELVNEQQRGIHGPNFGYNEDSVLKIEEFIESQRLRSDLPMQRQLVSVLGCWLGECIIDCFGGHWHEKDGSLVVAFDDHNTANPFAKIQKQFDRGRDDGEGIEGFFATIPILFGLVQPSLNGVPR